MRVDLKKKKNTRVEKERTLTSCDTLPRRGFDPKYWFLGYQILQGFSSPLLDLSRSSEFLFRRLDEYKSLERLGTDH